MKKQAIAAILMAAFAAPAFADNFKTEVFNNTPEQQVQVEELSQKEMKETEGAFLGLDVTVTQAAILNAGASSWAYAYGTDWGKKGSVEGGVMAASVGAMTGAAGEAAALAGMTNTALAVRIANPIYQYYNTQKSVLDDIY